MRQTGRGVHPDKVVRRVALVYSAIRTSASLTQDGKSGWLDVRYSTLRQTHTKAVRDPLLCERRSDAQSTLQ